ncbi:MAG TPA: hypothetical protein VNI01_11720 [Elusimicrobiota bacterium]|jgi:hypothetical protein|nr:hypothetical protein [Elusimicrobiota bacterium]
MRKSIPACVLALSAAALTLFSVSPRDAASQSTGSGGSTTIGGSTASGGSTTPSNPTGYGSFSNTPPNTYDAGYHDGAQAATQATIGTAQAAAASTVPTTDTSSSSSSGCS